MDDGSSLSDKALRAEVDSLMFGDHDTPASGISWVFYALATHPNHQQRCTEEVQSLLGDGSPITWWVGTQKKKYNTVLIQGVSGSLRLSLVFRMGFISGNTCTRCPIPPCASRRPRGSIQQYHLLAESSTHLSPSLMDAPYLKVWAITLNDLSFLGTKKEQNFVCASRVMNSLNLLLLVSKSVQISWKKWHAFLYLIRIVLLIFNSHTFMV